MSTTYETRTASRTQPAEVALIAPLLVTVVILLQPWIVLSQPSEQSLLYDFYNTTNGWASGCSGGWSTNTTPLCSGDSTTWARVVCSAGSVTLLNLGGCGIRGILPSQWSSLTNMQSLDLSSNSLSGILPPQWGSLTNMQYLDLNTNSLSGTLPPQWSNMINMQTLSLNTNSLNGTLPPQWSNLTNMHWLWLHTNSLSGTLPWQWSNMINMQYCHVDGNCLNTSNATAWWLNSTYRNIGSQRTTGCAAIVAHGVSRGVSLSLSNTRSESGTGSRSMVFSTSSSMSATHSLPSGSFLSVSRSSMSVGILGSLSVSTSVIAQTRRSVTHSSSATWSRWLASYSVSIPSLSGTPTMSRSQGTYSPSTASLAILCATHQVLDTMSLTPLCDAPPFAVNSSLRFAQPNNGSHCGEHLCPTASPSLIDGVGGVTLTVAYDAMMAAPSVLLLLAEDGIRHMWLSLLPSVWLGAVTLDAVADAAPSDGTVGVVVLRPSSGWPGLDVRPYAVQRLSLVVALRCRANGTVISHPTEMVLVVTPRSMPVAASVQAVVQSSQGIAGGLGGGAEALTMGRLAMSLSMLSCDDALQGFGAGQGVVSVSGNLLAAVDTIVGNVVFVAAVAAAAVLAACVLYLGCASSSCSWMACCREVLRLPLSLFPVFAATLPSTVMAVVAVLRDAPALSGGAASGAYCSIAVAAAVWGGALFLVGSATRRMALASTLRPADDALPDAVVAGCGSGAVVLMLRRALRSSTEWVAPQAADATLFEGTTVVWFLPLDVCTTVTVAVVSALPLSRSAALCVGANAVNVAGCAVMLAVAAVRWPFATAFGTVHSVVTYVMVLALAVCGLVLAATSSSRAANNGDAHSMLLVVSYLSGSAAVLSALKAAVDATGTVAATRRRFLTLIGARMQSCVGDGERLDDALVGEAGENDCHLMMTLPVGDVGLDCDIEVLQPEAPDEDSLFDGSLKMLLPEQDFHDHRLSDRFGDLLDAYQNVLTDEPPRDRWM